MLYKKQAKYYFIVLSLTLVTAAAYYFYLLRPMHAIQHERALIERYFYQLGRYQSVMNKIDMTSFDLQTEMNWKEISLLNESFREIPRMNYIGQICMEAKEGLDSITERKEFLDSINKDLFSKYEDIRSKSITLFGSEDVSLSQIQNASPEGDDERALFLIKFKILQLNRKMFTFNNLIDDTLNVINTQVALIDSKLNTIYFTINLLSALIVLAFLANVGALLLALPSSFDRRITDIRRNLIFFGYKEGQIAVKLRIEETSPNRGIRQDLRAIMNCLIIAFSGLATRFLKRSDDLSFRSVFEDEEAAERWMIFSFLRSRR